MTQDDSAPPILLEIRDAIARITLNRPEQANVLNDETGRAFIGVVRQVADDELLLALKPAQLAQAVAGMQRSYGDKKA